MAEELEKSLVRSKQRNKNIKPDELQALLKSCIDIGVEDARRGGDRTEHLFYDVQQRMAHYGEFPERKLYRLRKIYIRLERDFLSRKLNPYPPEARQLWGTATHNADAAENDGRWFALLERTLLRQQCYPYVLKAESSEIVRLALQKNLENLPPNEQECAFEEILSELKAVKMFLNRDVLNLKQAYFRMRKQFLTGRALNLPAEAAQLWKSSVLRENEPVFRISKKRRQLCRPKSPEKLEVKVETIVKVCRICQAQLTVYKDLLQDTYNSQTYGEIIQETIQVHILCDGQMSSKICLHCSKFLESLLIFIQQCKQACTAFMPIKFNECFIEEDCITEEDPILETDQQVAVIECLDEAVEYAFESISASTQENPSPPEDLFKAEPETIEDCIEETTVSDQQKYLEYVKSQPTRSKKKQCHLCGKSVIDLVNHLNSHSGVGFQCEFCPRKCPNQRQLTTHMNIHTKKKSYPCRICDRVFYVWTSRKNHEETHNAKFSCDKCDAVYTFKSQLRLHIKHKHLGIRHLPCPHCPFQTFNRARLLNHVRSIHTSERPYRCTFCDSTSNSCSGYYIHFQRHKKSGEAKEYSILCAYCGELFHKDVDLEKHICKEHPDVAVIV